MSFKFCFYPIDKNICTLINVLIGSKLSMALIAIFYNKKYKSVHLRMVVPTSSDMKLKILPFLLFPCYHLINQRGLSF